MAEPLAWKGPRGGISKNWMFREDQSLSKTSPKIESLASSIRGRWPRGTGFPKMMPISSSKSSQVSGWNCGAAFSPLAPTAGNTPSGRVTGVPEMTKLEVRPLYTDGIVNQLGLMGLGLKMAVH